MNGLIDGADRVYWWLRQHPPVAGGIGVAVVAVIAALLLLGGGGKGSSGKLPADAVAKVGDTPITRTQLAHWQGVYTAASTATTKPTAAEARKAAFELLAGSAWIVAEADRQDVVVTPAEAKTAADTYLKQAATQAKVTQAALLKQLGTTAADVQFQQRVSLLAQRLQEKIVKALPAPTAAQIKAAYDKDPGRWATPTQRNVEALITGTKADADAALAALKAGKTFAEVNTQYSTNSTLTQAGGKLDNIKPGTTEADVESPIFAAPVGGLQGPLKISDAYLVFRVKSSTPLATQTLAQASPTIKADLTATAQNAATTSFLTQLRKRWKPKTTCAVSVGTSDYCGTKS
ncbi:MAG: peptidylprolyl isomerase [Solirubrobacterales bacterium]|nr:peptidylprolyl isomerase [Solirubrobacterales bacterium]